ncbi:MAG: hypothetical protein ACRER8_10980, partial [Pseudomonas sp.]|uniref:hypothetical protein n=1 Tax=Pseudomonas sp. TaxID=306 RepID=UPI003D6F3890
MLANASVQTQTGRLTYRIRQQAGSYIFSRTTPASHNTAVFAYETSIAQRSDLHARRLHRSTPRSFVGAGLLA